MKNLKVYKRAIAILTASTLVLMSGCGKKSEENKSTPCNHITVYFEDEPITFKECEGYEIKSIIDPNEGNIKYTIYKKNKIIIKNGYTNQYNDYEVYHEVADEIIENESVQKRKLKLNK